MIIVTGGAYQGKTDFVKEQFLVKEQDMLDGTICEFEEIYKAKAINHFHELIRRLMMAGCDLVKITDRLLLENKELIIITNEIGCGLVPVERFEREYREQTGRICCKIAKKADQIFRIQCGIGIKIFDKRAIL